MPRALVLTTFSYDFKSSYAHSQLCSAILDIVPPIQHTLLHPCEVFAAWRETSRHVKVTDDSFPRIIASPFTIGLFFSGLFELHVVLPSESNLPLSLLLPVLNRFKTCSSSLVLCLCLCLLLLPDFLMELLLSLLGLLDHL